MENLAIKLGIIGLSEGHGHPYSWSAIINGYNSSAMKSCEFPVIPHYLSQQSWPEAKIQGASVDYIWTQDKNLSLKIANASNIPNIVSNPIDMIDNVDALLLARDDAENHFKFAVPFLQAGKPVYIDKPIALSVVSLNALYEKELYPGQIFSCSALRYSKELKLTSFDSTALGSIKEIHATTPNSWEKYSVHIIEPVLALIGLDTQPKKITTNHFDDRHCLNIEWSSNIITRFFSFGNVNAPIMIKIFGSNGYKELVFTDSFSAFKAALTDFIQGIKTKTTRTPYSHQYRVVQLIHAGLKNEK